jgi:hypothetical protein
MKRSALALFGAACLATASAGSAAELSPYLFTRPDDRPRSSVGLRVRASVLAVVGDLTAEARGARTRVEPRLSSKLALAPKLTLETQLQFAEWNGRSGLLDDAAVETRFKARAPLPLVREIEGSFRRGPDGRLRQRFGFGFVENFGLSVAGGLKLDTQAVFEQTVHDGVTDGVSSGLKASLTGLGVVEQSDVDSRLSLRLERRPGARASRRSTLGYHRAWRANEFLRLSLDCEVTRAGDLDGKVRVGWQVDF